MTQTSGLVLKENEKATLTCSQMIITFLCTGICSSQGRGWNCSIIPLVQIRNKRVTFTLDTKLTG